MIRKLFIICLILFVCPSNWKTAVFGQKNEEDIVLGKYQSFHSEILGGDVTYFIHVPGSYEKTDKSILSSM